jgi:hypothetical protein
MRDSTGYALGLSIGVMTGQQVVACLEARVESDDPIMSAALYRESNSAPSADCLRAATLAAVDRAADRIRTLARPEPLKNGRNISAVLSDTRPSAHN